MLTLDDLESLKRKVDLAKTDADKAEGAVGALLDRIRKDHGCTGAEEARPLLAKKERKRDRLLEEYLPAKAAFEARWADYLKRR